MNKKIFGLVVILVVAAINLVVSHNSKVEMLDLQFSDIEALANDVPESYNGPVVYVYTDHHGNKTTHICPGGVDKDCTIIMQSGQSITGKGVACFVTRS